MADIERDKDIRDDKKLGYTGDKTRMDRERLDRDRLDKEHLDKERHGMKRDDLRGEKMDLKDEHMVEDKDVDTDAEEKEAA